MTVAPYECHACKAESLEIFDGFEQLKRAASDCRPWPAGGKLGICTNCGVVQKKVDQEWRKEAAEIYAEYNLYHQTATGEEQPIFVHETGSAVPRSQQILKFAMQAQETPAKGRMMDLGCGNGAMLRAFSTLYPNWDLYGFEPHLTQPEKTCSIAGVQEIFTGNVNDISEKFDLITLIHALEHVENPVFFLESISHLLSPTGHFIIQVPYFPDNPFDLLIADHCTHFTIFTMKQVLLAAGFEILSLRTDIIEKEMTIVARYSAKKIKPQKVEPNILNNHRQIIAHCLTWVRDLANEAKALSTSNCHFGIFGTSISANWLLGELNQEISFFVDEDINRVNKLYRQKPVYLPQDAPTGSKVFMVLPRGLASKIQSRLNVTQSEFYLPPLFEKLQEIHH